MTISTAKSNAPHPKVKPSVSIIPQNVHSRDRSVVPNPLNTTLTGLTQNVNNNVAQKTSSNRQSEYLQAKMREQIKKAIMDASKNQSHQRNRGNMPHLSNQNYVGLRKLHHKLAKPLKSAPPKPMVQMKNAGPPPLVSISSAPNPAKTTPTIDLSAPEKPSSTLQSPLRSFMEHLHMLQMNMKEAAQGTATTGEWLLKLKIVRYYRCLF